MKTAIQFNHQKFKSLLNDKVKGKKTYKDEITDLVSELAAINNQLDDDSAVDHLVSELAAINNQLDDSAVDQVYHMVLWHNLLQQSFHRLFPIDSSSTISEDGLTLITIKDAKEAGLDPQYITEKLLSDKDDKTTLVNLVINDKFELLLHNHHSDYLDDTFPYTPVTEKEFINKLYELAQFFLPEEQKIIHVYDFQFNNYKKKSSTGQIINVELLAKTQAYYVLFTHKLKQDKTEKDLTELLKERLEEKIDDEDLKRKLKELVECEESNSLAKLISDLTEKSQNVELGISVGIITQFYQENDFNNIAENGGDILRQFHNFNYQSNAAIEQIEGLLTDIGGGKKTYLTNEKELATILKKMNVMFKLYTGHNIYFDSSTHIIPESEKGLRLGCVNKQFRQNIEKFLRKFSGIDITQCITFVEKQITTGTDIVQANMEEVSEANPMPITEEHIQPDHTRLREGIDQSILGEQHGERIMSESGDSVSDSREEESLPRNHDAHSHHNGISPTLNGQSSQLPSHRRSSNLGDDDQTYPIIQERERLNPDDRNDENLADRGRGVPSSLSYSRQSQGNAGENHGINPPFSYSARSRQPNEKQNSFLGKHKGKTAGYSQLFVISAGTAFAVLFGKTRPDLLLGDKLSNLLLIGSVTLGIALLIGGAYMFFQNKPRTNQESIAVPRATITGQRI
ncbi:MAG: hypothetical protein HRK26_03360 [Rickettsiaceae bacterium H1]|nr:hypothetical protein [Rickettsiaceae bacterium H1]